MNMLDALNVPAHERVIAEISDLDWRGRSEHEMVTIAWAYYYFSIQFRENLEIACELYPDDPNLAKLKLEECGTDNLSPYPGVAAAGERMDHDEFMRRLLLLSPISAQEHARFEILGARYLAGVRKMSPAARALSIASYEDGGLEQVFTAILTAPAYDNPLLNAFRFFLAEHIRFDSDPEQGHGKLARRLVPDESILPLWDAFKGLFTDFTPAILPDQAEGADLPALMFGGLSEDRSRRESVC